LIENSQPLKEKFTWASSIRTTNDDGDAILPNQTLREKEVVA